MSIPEAFREAVILPESEARQWLGKCGQGVKLFAGCRIANPDKVWVGDKSQIDEGVFLFPGEGIVIGRYVHLAFGSSVSGGGHCVIGDFAGIGAGVRLITGTDLLDGAGLTNPTVPEALRSMKRSFVKIGAHALIYTNSVVLPGVTVGMGAVVGAGSVVHHDLKPWGIYAGSPLVQVGVRPAETILRLAEQVLAKGKGQRAKSSAKGRVSV